MVCFSLGHLKALGNIINTFPNKKHQMISAGPRSAFFLYTLKMVGATHLFLNLASLSLANPGSGTVSGLSNDGV